MPLPRTPRFVVGDLDVTLRYPVTAWSLSEQQVGGQVEPAGRVVGYVARRDPLLTMGLRCHEAEQGSITELVEAMQLAESFDWYVNSDDVTPIAVTLESPAIGASWDLTPDPQYPRLLVVPMALRRVDGAVWGLRYFDPAA